MKYILFWSSTNGDTVKTVKTHYRKLRCPAHRSGLHCRLGHWWVIAKRMAVRSIYDPDNPRVFSISCYSTISVQPLYQPCVPLKSGLTVALYASKDIPCFNKQTACETGIISFVSSFITLPLSSTL